MIHPSLQDRTFNSFVEFHMEAFEMSRDTIERATRLAMKQARMILGCEVDFANPEDHETVAMRVAIIIGARISNAEERSEW